MSNEYIYPPLDLLEKGKEVSNPTSKQELIETANKLQDILKAFNIPMGILEMSQGPTVTRFELKPEPDVRISEILSLEDELKLHLATENIRMEIPVPGKAAIGLEIPNQKKHIVALRELLELLEHKNSTSELTVALGKDPAGNAVFSDISTMQHLLVGGSTGSGESIWINTIIMSILFSTSPEDIRMVLIDPKIAEFSVYNGIPHLLLPVVTDPVKAIDVLRWAVCEMVRRCTLFANSGVKNINAYNDHIRASNNLSIKTIPRILIVIDELADLMMLSAYEVEDAICRLTQHAKAAGIHLIIATQRPSVDVLTGLIKANISCKLAFAVSNKDDSRTILNQYGAEKLIGNGDILFSQGISHHLMRIQSAYVSDTEIKNVIDFLKKEAFCSPYDQDIEQEIKKIHFDESDYYYLDLAIYTNSDPDEYFVQAGILVTERQRASIGMLQRMLKISYRRAERIMNQLSEAGVVSIAAGNHHIQVLMTKERFRSIANTIENDKPS
ncbi:DNA translocase FtsK [Butyrivibrio sp. XBB1001]|uniref:DNA translocase FtsK n=1 Tax=Butyrivibrio sp. XBB1001 TaxID=1280682 RepID=UPI0004108D05|nr:DNA translocase FtsK [Butyrivibrio sp. XBB1001]